MDRTYILKQFRYYGWLVLPAVGAVLGIFLLSRSSNQPLRILHLGLSSVPSFFSDNELAMPIPLSLSAGRTAAKVSPPAQPASPVPQPTAVPSAVSTLTPEQQEINRRNKAEFEASLPTVDSFIEMRVAIAEGIPSTTLRTSTAAVILNREGSPVQTLTAGTTYQVQATGEALQLNGASLPAAVMIDPAPGVFYLGDRTYRGRLLLIADGPYLWAVNLVSMRSYLHSVVGSEVYPTWDMDALKAQAVAARSYALTHYFRPVNEIYHLGATERHQVYKGTEREAATIRQAVDETAGEFVSYRGDIVESLYAASDDIVMKAFEGRGMSQLGAQNLAEQGYTYKQILSHYYPSTGVAQIAQDIQ